MAPRTKKDTITVTIDGLEITIDKNIGDNFELMEQMAGSSEDPLALVKVLTDVYGKTQLARIKKHIRDKRGYVSTEEIFEFFAQTISAALPN
ncbi:hypothetical protein [Schaalia sp. lx-260]|uniref:hypothetical protein n=1 Tax=Schaalia sp. lx-260 TaxID=2899082 RepID=UPI001E39680C|nr:hypothetical protein [Schaalia sp. lx-260]MCD4549675.1 hypothetical protein [Schaalia sp. lx-260]